MHNKFHVSAAERRLLAFGMDVPPVRRNKETKKPELFMAEGETHKNEKAYDSVHARIKRYQERYEAAQKKLGDVGRAGADRSKDIGRPLNTLNLSKRDYKISNYLRDDDGRPKYAGVRYEFRGGRVIAYDKKNPKGREVPREEERGLVIVDRNNQYIEDEFGKFVLAGRDFNEVNYDGAEAGKALEARIFWRVAALERHYRDVEKIIADLEDKAGVDPGETLAAVNKKTAIDSLQKQFDAVNDQDKLETVHIDQYNNPFASREKGLYFLLRLPKDAEAKYVDTETRKEFSAGRVLNVSGGWKYYQMPDANMTGVDERTMQLKVTVDGEVRYATIERIYENNLRFTFEKKPEPKPEPEPPTATPTPYEEKPPVATIAVPENSRPGLIRDEPQRPGLIGKKKEETDERSADEALEEILSDPTVESGPAHPPYEAPDREAAKRAEGSESVDVPVEPKETDSESDEEGEKDANSKENESPALTREEFLKKAEGKNPDFAEKVRIVEELLERLKKFPEEYEKQRGVFDGMVYDAPEYLDNPMDFTNIYLWLPGFQHQLEKYLRDHESTSPKPAENDEMPEESEATEAPAAAGGEKKIKATPASMRTSDESSEVNTNQPTNETPNDVSQKEDASAGDKPNAKPEAESEQVAPKTEINKPPRPKEDWESFTVKPPEFHLDGIPNGFASKLKGILDRDREKPSNEFESMKTELKKLKVSTVQKAVKKFFADMHKDLEKAQKDARRLGQRESSKRFGEVEEMYIRSKQDLERQMQMMVSAYGEILRTLQEQSTGEWTQEQKEFQDKLKASREILLDLPVKEREFNVAYRVAIGLNRNR